MSKTALIYGTTGLIGSHLLHLLLEDDQYSKVKALTRRELGIEHPKLEEIIHDFDNPDMDLLRADDVFCCMGTTMKKAGTKENYIKIDHDYVVSTAKSSFDRGASLFSLVSAIGANSKSRIFYNRLKGDVEESLMKIGFESLHIFRPSLLLGDREEFRLLEQISQFAMKGLNFLIPSKSKAVFGSQVAGIMIHYASIHSKGIKIINNSEIVRFKEYL